MELQRANQSEEEEEEAPLENVESSSKLTVKVCYAADYAVDMNIASVADLALIKCPNKNNSDCSGDEISLLSLKSINNNNDCDWKIVLEPPKNDFIETQMNMILTHQNTNIDISVGDLIFKCHLLPLQCYSVAFQKITPGIKTIELPGQLISKEAYLTTYTWILSNEPTLDRKTIIDVFLAANYLDMKQLINHCWSHFDCQNNYSEQNSILLYAQTRSKQAFNLMYGVILSRISKMFLVYVATKDYVLMPTSHLIHMLKSSNVCVNSEIEIFYAAIRWLSYDWDRRRCRTVLVMKQVRFSKMPAWTLVFLTQNIQNEIIQYVVTLPVIRQMISQAIEDHSVFLCANWELNYSDEEIERLKQIKNMPARTWICDEHCSYHLPEGESTFDNVTYKQFLDYIKHLQHNSLSYWLKNFKIRSNEIAISHE